MIERAVAGGAGVERGTEPLMTFRISERIDGGQAVDFLAERLADHRAAYLTYEGEISGGRGSVRRVAEGELRILASDDRRIVLEGWLGEARGIFTGSAGPGGWRFEFVPEAPGSPPVRSAPG
jgi:hypothetical protein